MFTLRQVSKNTNDAVVGEVCVHGLTFTTIQIYSFILCFFIDTIKVLSIPQAYDKLLYYILSYYMPMAKTVDESMK